MPTKINIWTDGACSGNPGPGGWAYAASEDKQSVSYWKAGYCFNTTNNRMELTAILEAVDDHPNFHLVIHTDSLGAINWLTRKWKRVDPTIHSLCATIEQKATQHHTTYEFVHVRGHSGEPLNEFVDKEAVKQYKNFEIK